MISKQQRLEQYEKLVQPSLSKFEATKAIGMRAYWLSYGAESRIYDSHPDVSDVIEIAKLELQNKCMPILIHKYMPNGTIQVFNVNTASNASGGGSVSGK